MLERIRLFFECLTKWKIKECGNLEEAECIAIQSFGKGDNQSPGLSNESMAKIANYFIKLKFIPIIAQQEVAVALDNCRNIVHIVESTHYINSWQVCSETAFVMRQKGWNKVIIIAHPLHLWRVARHFKKLNMEVIIPYGLDQIPFDHQSSQWWTKSIFRWVIREIPVRLYCLYKGFI